MTYRITIATSAIRHNRQILATVRTREGALAWLRDHAKATGGEIVAMDEDTAEDGVDACIAYGSRLATYSADRIRRP